MSVRSLVAALAAMAVMAPATLRAQEEDIDFAKARKEFIAGQARLSANTLLTSSLGVRQQLGRCRDETVGTELLAAEDQLEKLASDLRAGSVKELRTLDLALAKIDRTLAHHHLLLVQATMKQPRADNIPVAAHDLDRAAYHFERSVTLAGGKLTDEQAAAVADIRKLSKDVETTSAFPASANATVASFLKLVVPAEVAAK